MPQKVGLVALAQRMFERVRFQPIEESRAMRPNNGDLDCPGVRYELVNRPYAFAKMNYSSQWYVNVAFL